MSDMLKFHTKELPEYADAGARYMVVAYYGTWRDGEVTDNSKKIPVIQRELRKRFMNRLQLNGVW